MSSLQWPERPTVGFVGGKYKIYTCGPRPCGCRTPTRGACIRELAEWAAERHSAGQAEPLRALVPTRHLGGPPVVGLAGRGAHHLVDEDHLFGDFESGQQAPSKRPQVVFGGRGPGCGLDERDDALAPAIVGSTDYDYVVYGFVLSQDCLHFLGV